MKKNSDPLKDLHRLIDKQNFKNESDMKEFLDSLIGKKLPEVDEEELTNIEKAQDLVEEAYDLPIREAFKNVEIALKLDPDCIEAYEFFAKKQVSVDSAIPYYEKAVKIGREIFGGEYLKVHQGQFWGFHETRPFMRCMFGYADILYLKGQKKDCIAILEEMIILNPNDNQGVRDQLMLYLLEQNDFSKFEKYSKLYPDEGGAYSHFNRALNSFKKEGESEKSNAFLKTAIEENKFVLPMIISSKLQTEVPETFGIGDKNEAKYYAVYAQRTWQQTQGAIKWLMKFRFKSR